MIIFPPSASFSIFNVITIFCELDQRLERHCKERTARKLLKSLPSGVRDTAEVSAFAELSAKQQIIQGHPRRPYGPRKLPFAVCYILFCFSRSVFNALPRR